MFISTSGVTRLEAVTAMRRGTARCAAAAVLFGATTPLAARLAEETSAPVLAGLLYIGAALAVAPLIGRRAVHAIEVRRSARRLTVAVVAGGLVGPSYSRAG